MRISSNILICLAFIPIYLVQSSELYFDSDLVSHGGLLHKRSSSDSVLCDCAEYVFFKELADWVTANDACTANGGRLAEIHDRETDVLIRQTINNPDNNLKDGLTGYWIGLTDRASENTFVWTSGQELEDCSYENWVRNEPNNNTKKNVDGQDCVQLWARRGFRWDDAYCNKEKGYICMYQVADCPDSCTSCAS
ncbi:perlucin-like protein [Ptychodera flava]|uniref:perlucin-like protein n=1 Tax=Ptychodera flava TaxID=63121 RepID=UPI00396A6E6A